MVVVALRGAVAAADEAFAYVDMVGQTMNCECCGAAVAFGKDGWDCCWYCCGCHFGFLQRVDVNFVSGSE